MTRQAIADNRKSLKNEKSEVPKVESLPLRKFYTYASKKDKIMIIIGTLAAVATGILLPCFALIIGDLGEAFLPQNEPDYKRRLVKEISGQMALLAVGTWIAGYIYYAFWQHIAENISYDLRLRYLKALLQ
ncbi:atp binding cassette subfamily b4 isoform 2 [Stylonychia lemnae]|uniref:Atp binding cassette subfamily b4 isoform 2 n=1 Tax=Stylonychia lemnae TaxID=5949 RepID=A0A077ZYP2_STYLE|nr:atp binding cassette subfamily b4 isoform 2 [Stylonychia lemnae]|eukprot:CDW75010.1 atp binding cassette subfamily b4 isoform 2 [Stylonychia lemnae]